MSLGSICAVCDEGDERRHGPRLHCLGRRSLAVIQIRGHGHGGCKQLRRALLVLSHASRF